MDENQSAPRPRRGFIPNPWVLVVTLAITETTSWGVLYYAFSVFILPMQAALGWSRASITGAFSLALLISALAGVPVGRWLDRRGPWLLMSAGSCASALLVLAWARTGSLLGFYFVWAGIGVVMAAVLYEPAFAVVTALFDRHRGRALTVLTFIAGFASVIYLPLAGWLVQREGWRTALLLLALVLAAGTIPLHLAVLPRRPPRAGAGAGRARDLALGTVVRGREFRWLTIAFCLNLFAGAAVMVHLVPYLGDRGYGAAFAAAIAGLVGVVALPGRLVFTPLGDYLSRRAVTAAIFFLQALSIAVLLLVPGRGGVAAFIVLFGAGFGAITPARAALVADHFGAARYASISGVMMLFATGARALGPVAAGVAHDRAGGYAAVFWALALLSAAAAVAVLFVERPHILRARSLASSER